MWSGCDRVKPAVYGCSRVSTWGRFEHVRLVDIRGQRQRRLDARLRDIFLAIDALAVDPEEDIHAVPGPLGDLGLWDPTAALSPKRGFRWAQRFATASDASAVPVLEEEPERRTTWVHCRGGGSNLAAGGADALWRS